MQRDLLERRADVEAVRLRREAGTAAVTVIPLADDPVERGTVIAFDTERCIRDTAIDAWTLRDLPAGEYRIFVRTSTMTGVEIITSAAR